MADDNRTMPRERQDAEIALLEAMYPDTLQWNQHRQELVYEAKDSAKLILRLPDDYPGKSMPILISALDGNRTDLRSSTRARIQHLSLPHDEEIIDTIIQGFEEMVRDTPKSDEKGEASSSVGGSVQSPRIKTVIIWLHHLLNTNKRKLALHPGLTPNAVHGLTKPGYPGILVYSGDSDAIDAHVTELKSQRWQAFQIRYEELLLRPWSFVQTSGIVEVETLSEMTQSIQDQSDREAFLKAVGVK